MKKGQGQEKEKEKGKEKEKEKEKGEGKGKGKEKEKEGDNEAGAKKRKTVSLLIDGKLWTKNLASRPREGEAKHQAQKGSSRPTAAKYSTMNDQQIALAHTLCRERFSFADIAKVMGVPGGTVSPYELTLVMVDAEVLIAEEEERRNGFTEFQVYDPKHREKAEEENLLDATPNEEEAPVPDPFEYIEEEVPKSSVPAPSVPTSGLEFVRALKDSKQGSKPYFRKGDVLRVINKAQRKNLEDGHFELLPLKPPGESGRALIRDFEPADLAAVDKVARAARTAKEKDSFRYAIKWDD